MKLLVEEKRNVYRRIPIKEKIFPDEKAPKKMGAINESEKTEIKVDMASKETSR